MIRVFIFVSIFLFIAHLMGLTFEHNYFAILTGSFLVGIICGSFGISSKSLW